CAGQRGVRRLASALALLTDDPDILRSELERLLRERLLSAPLPPARFNQHVTGASGRLWEVDALWAQAGLVVEADGRAFHSSPAARRRDERKQADLEAAGLEVWRIRWYDVHGGWPALEARLFTRTRR
ncbi:MAG TPA: hypothetical protein VD931_16960, partial [Baekduia sp.]|nr:hypothetical protein [Baekduia sp.]